METLVNTETRDGARAAQDAFRGLRVVVVAPDAPPPTGMAVQGRRLAARLRGDGAEVVQVASNPRVPAPIAQVPAFAEAWRRNRYLAGLRDAIAARADVLIVYATSGKHFRQVVAPALREARDAGMRTVLRWEGGDADRFFANEGNSVRADLALADEITVASPFLASVFRTRMAIEPRVVPNLVDDPVSERPPVRDEGALRLLVARPLSRVNGVDLVLRAVAIAAERGEDVRLTVLGDGPEREALEDLGARTLLGRIAFPGPVPHDEFRRRLAETDVLVNGSWMDNAPVSLAEALAEGVPVVTTEAGGIPWIVQHGRTGLVTPVGDAEALGASLLSLARDRSVIQDLGWRARVEALRWTWPVARDIWATVCGRRASV
jgi:glycosyltransferase involved in cell wall biosynthesis